ncbi:MAG TPA: TRAP transporter large permease subunit, partial [Halomonas sp.]|nr:TRAP transporter large permease subunit [Halomonas sp.]
FTPTEASGIAVGYAIILIAIRRELTRDDIFGVIRDTVKYTGIFMFIVMLASSFAWILIREQVGAIIFGSGFGGQDAYVISLLAIMLGILIIGCFMETISALALIVPVLAPASLVLGIDPVHLGIVVIFGLQIGLITPPIGMAMYIVSSIAEITIYDFVRTVLPFLAGMLVIFVLIAFVPSISTYLPGLIFGRAIPVVKGAIMKGIPHPLSASEALQSMADKSLSGREYMALCYDRIRQREDKVQAWECLTDMQEAPRNDGMLQPASFIRVPNEGFEPRDCRHRATSMSSSRLIAG